MSAAVLTSTFTGVASPSTKTPGLAMRIVHALVASRVRSAAKELRRHEALRSDLARRQDHSSDFLMQSNDLPFKV